MSDADCAPGREPRSVAASSFNLQPHLLPLLFVDVHFSFAQCYNADCFSYFYSTVALTISRKRLFTAEVTKTKDFISFTRIVPLNKLTSVIKCGGGSISQFSNFETCCYATRE